MCIKEDRDLVNYEGLAKCQLFMQLGWETRQCGGWRVCATQDIYTHTLYGFE